jgi:hypothetical protein
VSSDKLLDEKLAHVAAEFAESEETGFRKGIQMVESWVRDFSKGEDVDNKCLINSFERHYPRFLQSTEEH